MTSAGSRHDDRRDERRDDRRDDRRADRRERRAERRDERDGEGRGERRGERRTERDERRADRRERRAERHDRHDGDHSEDRDGKRPYHHGDLRNALISAAAELAAEGGPGSVTIRAAARQVGVTPTAAYRHFAGQEQLLSAARDSALDELTAAMRKELAGRAQSDDPVRYALGSLAALGRGYIAFARAEPGLFRTVFWWDGPPVSERDGQRPDDPFGLLLESLDELVAVGYLTVERRPLAEVAAWSMVHGLAMLLDGPLRDVPPEVRTEAIVKAILVLGHGLSGTGLTPEQETLLAADVRSGG